MQGGVPPPPPPPSSRRVPEPPPPSQNLFRPPGAPAPPPIELGPPTASFTATRTRSRYLAAALFLKGTGAILGVLFGTIGYFAMSHADPNTILDHQPVKSIANALLAMIIVSSIQLVGVLGTLAWKKWGVYLLAASGTFGILVSLKGDSAAQAGYGLLGMAFLGYAVATRWGDFED